MLSYPPGSAGTTSPAAWSCPHWQHALSRLWGLPSNWIIYKWGHTENHCYFGLSVKSVHLLNVKFVIDDNWFNLMLAFLQFLLHEEARETEVRPGSPSWRLGRSWGVNFEDADGLLKCICSHWRVKDQQQWKLKPAVYLQARASADSCDRSRPGNYASGLNRDLWLQTRCSGCTGISFRHK